MKRFETRRHEAERSEINVRPTGKTFFASSAALALTAATLLGLSACAPDRPVDTAEPARFPGVAGLWRVVAHRPAGVEAMTPEEADAWIGQPFRYDRGAVGGPRLYCSLPSHTIRQVHPDSLFLKEFGISGAEAGVPEFKERISVQETSCDELDWAAPAARLILIDRNRALMPWEGVLFELERGDSDIDIAFRAVGNEPGWLVEVVRDRYIHLYYAYGARELYAPIPTPTPGSSPGSFVYRVETDGYDLEITIDPTACSDVMSGEPFPSTVTVRLNGETFRGCGSEGPRWEIGAGLGTLDRPSIRHY